MVKDVISLNKNKPNLINSFNEYLEKVKKEEEKYYRELAQDPSYLLYLAKKYGSLFTCFPSEDDNEDFFDGYSKNKKEWKKQRRLLLEGHNSRGHKNNKRGGKRQKNKKRKDFFDEDDMMYDAHITDKTIYYYRDFNQPDDVEVFFNLHDFDQFLEEEGIEVSQEEVTALMTRDISHCCINPNIRETNGNVELVTDSSYGGLYWQCCPETDFSYD